MYNRAIRSREHLDVQPKDIDRAYQIITGSYAPYTYYRVYLKPDWHDLIDSPGGSYEYVLTGRHNAVFIETETSSSLPMSVSLPKYYIDGHYEVIPYKNVISATLCRTALLHNPYVKMTYQSQQYDYYHNTSKRTQQFYVKKQVAVLRQPTRYWIKESESEAQLAESLIEKLNNK